MPHSPTLDSQTPDGQEMASQQPGYVPNVNAVLKVHDASEDEITGHRIVDYIVVCVQGSLYPASYLTTRIFESINQV